MPSAPDPRSLRALILNDSTAHAASVVSDLEQTGWVVEARQAANVEAFTEALTTFAPDIVLAAPTLSDFCTFQALTLLSGLRPGCPFIVVANSIDTGAAVALIRAGAEDVVQRDGNGRLDEAVSSAISVRQRLKLLSPRQRQVLALVARGNTSPEIATHLNISVKTVETHRGELMKRIGARDVVGLVHYALRVGLVPNAA